MRMAEITRMFTLSTAHIELYTVTFIENNNIASYKITIIFRENNYAYS